MKRISSPLIKSHENIKHLEFNDNMPKIITDEIEDYITSYLHLKFYNKKDDSHYSSIYKGMRILRPYFYKDIKIEKAEEKQKDDQCNVHFIDCGNGDCILLENKGEYALIDFGSRDNYTENNQNKVSDYLKDHIKGKQIKYAIITHIHSDHIYDLPLISKKFIIDKVRILRNYDHKYKSRKENLQKIENMQANEIEFIDVEQIVNQEIEPFYVGDIKLQIIGPVHDFAQLNNNSLVVKADYKDTSILFTGDMEKQAERALISHCEAANIDLSKINILKVAHHGSNTSSSKEFLEVLKNDNLHSVISSGDPSLYSHPDPVVVKRLEKKGTVMSTYALGNVNINVEQINQKQEEQKKEQDTSSIFMKNILKTTKKFMLTYGNYINSQQSSQSQNNFDRGCLQ